LPGRVPTRIRRLAICGLDLIAIIKEFILRARQERLGIEKSCAQLPSRSTNFCRQISCQSCVVVLDLFLRRRPEEIAEPIVDL
jgi:hypothetical protein